jgi:hypothetical protein
MASNGGQLKSFKIMVCEPNTGSSVIGTVMSEKVIGNRTFEGKEIISSDSRLEGGPIGMEMLLNGPDSRTVRVFRAAVDPITEVSLSGEGRVSLVLEGEGGILNFPRTIVDFAGGVMICGPDNSTSFVSLTAPDRKVIPLSSVNKFIVGTTTMPGGAYLITDSEICPQFTPGLKHNGIDLGGLLSACLNRNDGVNSEFEQWIDAAPGPKKIGNVECVKRHDIIVKLRQLAIMVVGGSPGSLFDEFMARAEKTIRTYPSVDSLPPDSIPVTEIVPIVLNLKKVRDFIEDLPESLRKFAGDFTLDESGGVVAGQYFALKPGTTELIPVPSVMAVLRSVVPYVQELTSATGSAGATLARNPAFQAIKNSVDRLVDEMNKEGSAYQQAIFGESARQPEPPPLQMLATVVVQERPRTPSREDQAKQAKRRAFLEKQKRANRELTG